MAGVVSYWAVQYFWNKSSVSKDGAMRQSQTEGYAVKFEDIEFEKPQQQILREDNRDIIDSQHEQVMRSWQNPGVYAWGSNAGHVAAPGSKDNYVKNPTRISYFDGMLLRDCKLGQKFAAAINEEGDLVQWGTLFSPDCKEPEVTLKGMDLRSLVLSEDRVIALSDSGDVYSIPASKEEQQKHPKLKLPSWFWSSGETNIACRKLTPQRLGIGEHVVSIAGGLEHVLFLTSKGRVFSACSSGQDFPKVGQMGVRGLNWYNRSEGPFDQCYEVMGLRGVKVKKIAAGDTHSVALDREGNVYTFGDNSYGQVGMDYDPQAMDVDNALNVKPHVIDSPVRVPIEEQYINSAYIPKVVNIAAGGQNSYFMVDAERRAGPAGTNAEARRTGTVQADTFACGRGIWGTLGNGKYTHIQWKPAKMESLSGLSEFNERTGRMEPIRLSTISVGQNHAAATMSNITMVAADPRAGGHDTNYGADTFFFGNNEHFQLGTRKRANRNEPTYIQPLDDVPDPSKPPLKNQRFQVTPGKKISVDGRKVWVEQRVECGRNVTAVYSGVL